MYRRPYRVAPAVVFHQPAILPGRRHALRSGRPRRRDQGGGNFAPYTTYDTLTALSVNGMIDAVVTKGDVSMLSQIQQIQDQRLKDTGGEMDMLNGPGYLVVGPGLGGRTQPRHQHWIHPDLPLTRSRP